MTNLWDTVEANSWSRDFEYPDYLKLYNQVFPTGTPFSQKTYQELCVVFDNLMKRQYPLEIDTNDS